MTVYYAAMHEASSIQRARLPRPWASGRPPSATVCSVPAQRARRPSGTERDLQRLARQSAKQVARPSDLLSHGPEAYGLRGQLWTRSPIAADELEPCGYL